MGGLETAMLLFFAKPTITAPLSAVAFAITSAGIAGFAYNLKILSQKFWKQWLIVVAIGEVLSLVARWSEIPNVIVLFIVFVLIVGELWILFMYAHKSPQVWSSSDDPFDGSGKLFVSRWGAPPPPAK
jgi:hypothetical protein